MLNQYFILELLKPSENLYGYLCFPRLQKCITDQLWVATTKKLVYIVYNFLENMSSYVALDQYSHSISPEFIVYQIFLMISEFLK